MIRILLADDHNIFRQGLREILESEPDIPPRLFPHKSGATSTNAMDPTGIKGF